MKQARRRGFLLGRWGKERPSFGDNWRRGRQTKTAAGTNKRRWMCDALSQERSAHNTHDTTVRWMRHGGGRVARTLACGRESGICFRCLCGICCGCTGPVTTLRRARFESRDACDVSVCCGCAHYEKQKDSSLPLICHHTCLSIRRSTTSAARPPSDLHPSPHHAHETIGTRGVRARDALPGAAWYSAPWEHIRRTAAHSAQIKRCTFIIRR